MNAVPRLGNEEKAAGWGPSRVESLGRAGREVLA